MKSELNRLRHESDRRQKKKARSQGAGISIQLQEWEELFS